MVDKKELNTILEVYKEGNYKVNSDRNMDVLGNNVQEQITQGKKILICSCKNNTVFSNGESLCIHKLFYMAFPFIDLFVKKLKEPINFYEVQANLEKENKNVYDGFVDELKEIKGIKFSK